MDYVNSVVNKKLNDFLAEQIYSGPKTIKFVAYPIKFHCIRIIAGFLAKNSGPFSFRKLSIMG